MACMVIYFSEQFHHIAQKMDADPAYARQIVAKLRQWKEDYDRWDNTVAASSEAMWRSIRRARAMCLSWMKTEM